MNAIGPNEISSGHHASPEAGLRPADPIERRIRAAASMILALSVAYALAATVAQPHRVALADAVGVFLAGAVPGLVVTLLLSMAQPSVYCPALRRRVIGVSLTGALGVAALSLLIPRF